MIAGLVVKYNTGTCGISGRHEDTLVTVLYAILFRSVADELRIFESIHHPNIINHYGVEIHRYQESFRSWLRAKLSKVLKSCPT
jgi:hypothetical protein